MDGSFSNRTRLAGLALAGLMSLTGAPRLTAEEALGRLFFNPERRQQLDRQRELNVLDKQQTPADPTLTLDGVVTRSSGKRTVWVNGNPQHESEAWPDVTVVPRLREPGTVWLRTNESPGTKVRVGETVNRNTGESMDLLNGGRISSRPPLR